MKRIEINLPDGTVDLLKDLPYPWGCEWVVFDPDHDGADAITFTDNDEIDYIKKPGESTCDAIERLEGEAIASGRAWMDVDPKDEYDSCIWEAVMDAATIFADRSELAYMEHVEE